MTLENITIQHRITTVLCERFHVSSAILGSENWDKPLTGNMFRFSAIDLTYLFFELERVFKVRIPQLYLNSYGICSINKMAEAIDGAPGHFNPQFI